MVLDIFKKASSFLAFNIDLTQASHKLWITMYKLNHTGSLWKSRTKTWGHGIQSVTSYCLEALEQLPMTFMYKEWLLQGSLNVWIQKWHRFSDFPGHSFSIIRWCNGKLQRVHLLPGEVIYHLHLWISNFSLTPQYYHCVHTQSYAHAQTHKTTNRHTTPALLYTFIG